MTACQDCRAAEETKGLWRRFDSLHCQWCAARLIQCLGRLNMPQGESPATWRDKITARRKAVLADSVSTGMDEASIRKLVSGGLAIGGAKK